MVGIYNVNYVLIVIGNVVIVLRNTVFGNKRLPPNRSVCTRKIVADKTEVAPFDLIIKVKMRTAALLLLAVAIASALDVSRFASLV